MNFRHSIIIVSIILLSGCNQTRIEKLNNQVADLQEELAYSENKNIELQEKIDEAGINISEVESDIANLKLSLANLNFAISGFSTEDWQNVVPGVASFAADIESDTSSLESSVEELRSSLE